MKRTAHGPDLPVASPLEHSLAVTRYRHAAALPALAAGLAAARRARKAIKQDRAVER